LNLATRRPSDFADQVATFLERADIVSNAAGRHAAEESQTAFRILVTFIYSTIAFISFAHWRIRAATPGTSAAHTG
jgi:hypothetical protein